MTSSADDINEDTVERLEQNVENPVWRLFRTYCWPHIHYLTVGSVSNILARQAMLVPALVLGVAFDSIFMANRPYQLPLVPADWLPTSTMDQFWFSMGLLAAAYGGWAILNVIQGWAWNIFTYRVQHDVRTDAYVAMQGLEMGFFDSQQTGELMSILNNDVNQLENFLNNTLDQAITVAFFAAGVGLFMFLLNWQLTLVAFVAPPIIAVFNYGFSRVIEPKHQRVRERVGALNTRIENNLSGMGVIKSYNGESFEQGRIEETSEAYRDASWDVARTQATLSPAMEFITGVGFVLTFFVGGYWLLVEPPGPFTAELTAGTLLTFLFYTRRFGVPMRQITSIIDGYQQTKAAGGRVLGLLNEPRTVPEQENAIELTEVEGHVQYEDVTFAYDSDADATLQDVTFEASPGDMIGIVGSTGAGKSTLMKLLLRFYDVDEGVISMDGHDIREVSLKSLRNGIGYVSQDPYLFDGTIRENIAYGRPHTTSDEIRQAAQQAGAHEFVEQLPDGYDTQVGERGMKLSGGQRQRVSIARAILSDPDVLILDEATSHVDNETEALIQNNLEDLVADRTTLAIAHRLSTVRHADQILVMENGKIVERGTHNELLERDGLYANLWKVQVGEVGTLPEEFLHETTTTG